MKLETTLKKIALTPSETIRKIFKWTSLILLFTPLTIFAQSYPSKPIRMIVPYAAGGSTDLTARLIARSLSISLGQPVIVDNRAGAGGTIGQDVVAKAAPDGYTILFSAAGPLVVSPNTYGKLSYDPIKGFDPVILIATQPLLLVVNPETKIYSVSDLIKEAKEKRGKLNYGSFGNGSAAHLAAESFKFSTKIDMVHVPYKGSSPALTSLVGGDIDLMFDVFSTAAPFVKADKLRAIAITSKERSPQFPDVPTMEQAGVMGMDAGTWFGVLVPAGTSKPIIDTLNKTLNNILLEKEVKDALLSQGATIRGGTPEQFNDFFLSEYKKAARLVKVAGISEN